MNKLFIGAAAIGIGAFFFMEVFTGAGIAKNAGAGATGDLRKLMRACMSVTSEFCTPDMDLAGVRKCIGENLENATDACKTQYEKTKDL